MENHDDDRLLEHSYDGIQEYDNPLPTWWVLIFYATILVVPVYLWNPFGIGSGPGREQAYQQEMAKFAAEHPQPTGPTVSDDQLLAMSKDDAKLAAGKAVYATNCVACHRPDGGGLIGPNLTDDFWIHGGTPTQIHTTIVEGVLAKGMPPWGKLLKPDAVETVTAYVMSLHGTNPPNPKEPQGAKEGAESSAPAAAPAAKKTPY